MDKIVHHDDVLKLSVLDNSEIFNKEAILGFHAVFAVKEAMNGLFGSIEIVDNGFCVVESSSREDVDVVVLVHVCQEFKDVWSDVELEFISFVHMHHICFFFLVEDGVDKRFVKVQNQKFLFAF